MYIMFVIDDRKANVHVQQTDIPTKLRQMVDLLVDEEARQEDNTTGVCMEYFLKNAVLQYLVNVAEKADYPVGIRGEAIRTIASMVDLLDDRFLVHNAIHKPTIKLLRFCVLDDRQSELYSDDLVDLMYIICSKIHGFPALLYIFFHDKHWLTTPQKKTDYSSESNDKSEHVQENNKADEPEYEFLLFTYLLRFVHREGRSGDFARTGLLFLMEMAKDQLGDFILGSDFATIMAAGLGALYSQLPRKLIVRDETNAVYSNPVTFLLGQDLADNNVNQINPLKFPIGLNVEYSNSPEFKYQLDSFLKLLEFCQDVLIRCPNNEICASLLNSVRAIFLQNILYPSILECSDMDGSSVAVISYIDLILQTVQQNDLAKVVVGFLMDDEDISTPPILPPSKSANGNMEQVISDEPEDYGSEGIKNLKISRDTSTHVAAHFNLQDLIFSRLKSKSQTTVIATLKLLKTIITTHCQYSLKLLSIYPDNSKHTTIISHHLREIELYFSLIASIDKKHAKDVLACGYESYLRDIEMTIDYDACYQNLKPSDRPGLNSLNESPKVKRRRSFKYGQRYEDYKKEEKDDQEKVKKQSQQPKPCKRLFRHKVRSSDPLLQSLLTLLSHFFTQSSEMNLALTGVISALALCPYRSLEGWLSFCENDRTNPDDILILNSGEEPSVNRSNTHRQDMYAQFDTDTPVNEDDDDDDRSIDFGAERESFKMTSPVLFKSYPPFFTLLRTLTQQVDYYRSDLPQFDELLEERRNALIKGEMSFADKRILTLTPSKSTSAVSPSASPYHFNSHLYPNQPTHQSPIPNGKYNRRPSVLRPSVSTEVPSSMSPSSSATTSAGTNHARLSPNPPPINMNVIMNNPMSPLAHHVRRTLSMKIQPLFPSHFVNDREEPILDLDDEDENTFSPKTSHPSRPRRVDKTTEITISMLLNNIVILEETIKELVALMQVRRSLGIDEISYV
ncbi:Retinoic acid induced 16-like protein-domain-containing protein [Pilobolus umbonatus]|nr:Retinoic acid induced 16-like protein-domain-containing protein [Pilobolus umbonatus]